LCDIDFLIAAPLSKKSMLKPDEPKLFLNALQGCYEDEHFFFCKPPTTPRQKNILVLVDRCPQVGPSFSVAFFNQLFICS